jgi:hypothetical protein
MVLINYGTKGFKFKDVVLMARSIKEDVENEIQQIFAIYDGALLPCVSGKRTDCNGKFRQHNGI